MLRPAHSAIMNTFLLVWMIVSLGASAAPAFARSALAGESAPAVSVDWDISATTGVSSAFSRGGKFLILTTRNGAIDCYACSGEKLYSTRISGADRAVIAPDASVAAGGKQWTQRQRPSASVA